MKKLWISTRELLEQEPSIPGLSSLVRQAKADKIDKDPQSALPAPGPDDAKSVHWQSAQKPAKRDPAKKVSKKAQKKAAIAAKKKAAQEKQARGKGKKKPEEFGTAAGHLGAKMKQAQDKEMAAQASKFGPPHSMGEIHHDEPSLASRHRPDLPPAHERHKAFDDAYHHERAKTTQIRHHGRSINAVFHGEMRGGEKYWAKPHTGALAAVRGQGGRADPEEFEPHEWHNRHHASYEVMAAMGAHHMVVPGLGTKMHGHPQMPTDAPHPDTWDSPEKRERMARHYAGGDSLVTQHAGPTVTVGDSSRKQRAGVDHEHRLHGIVNHVLFGNTDGHRGNVMIHEEHGHPVIIDNDLSLSSKPSRMAERRHGKPHVRSIFAPGGMLDYTENLPKGEDGKQKTEVGKDFPPRMQKTLKWLAEGGHREGKGKLKLSDSDAKALQNNALHLIEHGLEGALSKRSVRNS